MMQSLPGPRIIRTRGHVRPRGPKHLTLANQYLHTHTQPRLSRTQQPGENSEAKSSTYMLPAAINAQIRWAMSSHFTTFHLCRASGHTCMKRGYLVCDSQLRGPSSYLLIEGRERLSTEHVSCHDRHPSHVIPRRQSRTFFMIEQGVKKKRLPPLKQK